MREWHSKKSCGENSQAIDPSHFQSIGFLLLAVLRSSHTCKLVRVCAPWALSQRKASRVGTSSGRLPGKLTVSKNLSRCMQTYLYLTSAMSASPGNVRVRFGTFEPARARCSALGVRWNPLDLARELETFARAARPRRSNLLFEQLDLAEVLELRARAKTASLGALVSRPLGFAGVPELPPSDPQASLEPSRLAGSTKAIQVAAQACSASLERLNQSLEPLGQSTSLL